jgi:hypothetical protein
MKMIHHKRIHGWVANMNQMCAHDGLSKDANFKNTYTHVAPFLETKPVIFF